MGGPKKYLKPGIAVLASASVLTALLAGCGTQTQTAPSNSSSSTTATEVPNATIQIDAMDDFAHLDPALAYDVGSYEPVLQFYDQLVTYEPTGTKIVSDVASTWDVSSDGLTYTFHLNPNVKFWNGDPVTAQSFIDEFKRVLSPSIASPGEGFLDPIVQGATDFNKGKAKEVSGLSAPDANTLVIKLTKPQAYFLYIMAMPFFSAIDQQYVSKIGDKQFDHQPMGSGPFEMKSYKIGDEMVLTKNPNYFKAGVPKLQEIDMYINKNAELSALKFQQGKSAFIGWNQTISTSAFVPMMNNPKFKNDFQKEELVATYYLALNSKPSGPIQNKLVRQAINMAIDKQKLVKLQNGRAAVANQILPPLMPGYEQNLPSDVNYQYDITKAKQLLTQAGYPNGFTTKLLTPNDPTSLQLVQSMQADLAQIGITANVTAVSSSTYLSDAESLNFPIVFTAWFQDFPDPSDFLSILLNGNQIPANNWSNYNNPAVNALLDKAATMPLGQPRLDIYDQAQNMIMADAPWVPLYTPIEYAVVQPWVKGFTQSPTLMDPLQNIYVVQH